MINKKMKWVVASFAMIGALGLVVNADDIAAKKKTASSINYAYKNGTLTIKGKGEIRGNSALKKYRNKAKKIIVKNGITAINKKSFYKFKKTKYVNIAKSVKKIGAYSLPYNKLEKVVMPGDFDFYGDFEEESTYSSITYPYVNADVEFNTDIKLDSLKHVFSKSFKAKKGDKNYITKDGVIYTKDGKSVVKIPFSIGRYNVAEGTESVDMQAFYYCSNHMRLQLNLPSSVKKINRYVAKTVTEPPLTNPFKTMGEDISVDFNDINLDDDSLSLLYGMLYHNRNNVLKKYKAKGVVVENGDFILTKDGKYLIAYTGKSKNVTIPEGVEVVGYCAMSGSWDNESTFNIKKVVLPDSVKSLKDGAFMESSDLEEINLGNVTELGNYSLAYTNLYYGNISDKVTTIGEGIFYGSRISEAFLPNGLNSVPYLTYGNCSSLVKVQLPTSVKTIGRDAFMGCDKLDIELNHLLDNVERVEDGAFSYCYYGDLVIPASIKYIGKEAFANEYKHKNVTIKGSTKNYDMSAFAGHVEDAKVVFAKKSEMKSGIKSSQLNTDYFDKIKWVGFKAADGYKVCISNNSSFKKNKKMGLYNITKFTSKTELKRPGKLKSGINYVKVTPYTKKGKKKVYGRVSEVVEIE